MITPFIRKLEQLFPLTPEEKDLLQSSCSRTLEFRADKDIVREGEQPTDCNLLLEGMVFRYKVLEDGKRLFFRFTSPATYMTRRASCWRRWTTASRR